jgi:hypothetical protein
MSHMAPTVLKRLRRPSAPTVAAALIACGLSACGGSGDSTSTSTSTSTSNTVPGAPTIGTATAGNASASIAFTAPSSNGGATITGYTATCSAGTASKTGTGTASPVTVSSLSNDTAYSCSVAATNSVGTGAASASVSVTPTAGSSGSSGTSTAGVQCSYSHSAFNSTASVNATSTSSWSCTSSSRVLTANGLPDHDVGTFPNANNPNTISSLSVSATYTLSPTATSTSSNTGMAATGYLLNGVKIDPGTAGSCNDSGSSCSLIGNVGNWSIEALGQSSFNFGTDSSNAHVQPNGAYHYHGMPEGFITRQGKGSAMTLVGWAADGFPIYARYGYTVATDATSAVKVIKGSYQLKATPDTSRPATSLYAMGTFRQDYEYVAGSGDLDECNGRTGVTPEFPGGIYHYYATDTYPFLQRCVKGQL